MSDATDEHDSRVRTVGAVLFGDFELLDVFGPLEMLGVLPQHFRIVMLAERPEPVPSAQGPRAAIDRTFDDPGHLDVLLVPGGQGTRRESTNPRMLDFLTGAYPSLELVASVCTGAGLLAAAGLLAGRRATSNKQSFEWVTSQSAETDWIAEARWVEDGNVWTSGGVAAGMDMTLALIARLTDADTARWAAEHTEYEWHTDAAWDPFARRAGLV